MHAGNRQAHYDRCPESCQPNPTVSGVAQIEGQPEGYEGGENRDKDRHGHNRQIVGNGRSYEDGAHPYVMHRHNAEPHHQAAYNMATDSKFGAAGDDMANPEVTIATASDRSVRSMP